MIFGSVVRIVPGRLGDEAVESDVVSFALFCDFSFVCCAPEVARHH